MNMLLLVIFLHSSAFVVLCVIFNVLVCYRTVYFVLQILLVNRQDGQDYQYLAVVLPLFVSLFTLMLMSFGTKGGNQCKLMLYFFIAAQFTRVT